MGGLSNKTNTRGFTAATAPGDTAQNVGITDILCEGPIAGLSNGVGSVFLNNNSVKDISLRSFVPGSSTTLTVTSNTTASFNSSAILPSYITQRNITRNLFLEFFSQQVTTTAAVHTDTQQTRITLDASSGTPFTSSHTTEGFPNRSARLIKSGRVDVRGQTTLVDNNTLTFVPDDSTSNINLYPNATDYIVKIIYKVPAVLHNVTPGSSFTLAASIDNGTYPVEFISAVYTPNQHLGATDLFFEKFDKLGVAIRTGELNQAPLNELLSAQGGSSAILGSTSGINLTELKQLSDSRASALSISLFDNSSTSYPEGQSSDRNANETILDSADFGLDTAAKIREADEVYFSIAYPALQTLNLNKGNSETAYVFYLMQIDTKQNGAFNNSYTDIYANEGEYVQHSGDTNAPISWEHRVNLDHYRPFEDFKIRIIRVSRHIGLSVTFDGTNDGRPDRKKWQIAAKASISGLGAIIKDKFSFPYTSLCQIAFSSKLFNNSPERSYLLKGLKVKVPSTYTPREYSTTGKAVYEEFWDGTYKAELQYTDNPAWIFLDLVTNNRYGAGKWISGDEIDKYALYRISRYCDELVEDGKIHNATDIVIGDHYKIKTVGNTTFTNHGSSANTVDTEFRATSVGTGTGTVYGLEPRYRANIFLTKATDVYKVLKDMASMFTGMIYWMDSKLTVVQDTPQDPVYSFTKGNVIDGAFSYQTSTSRAKSNQVVVTWNDPTINFEPVPLIVEDRESIARTGRIISQNAVAFGATSEGQATRLGKWKLYTAQNQTEIVSFATSLAAAFLKPGDVINIQDADRTGISYSGRVSSATSTTLTMDRSITFNSGTTYELSTLVTESAAFYTGDSAVTVNGVTYNTGDRIPQAFVHSSGSYSLTNLDTEKRASNAFVDSSGSALLSIAWKEHSFVQTNTITNPGAAATTVTIASSGTFGTTPVANTIWALRELDSQSQDVQGSKKLYKILSISQTDKNIYNISAVEHSNEKYEEIEKRYKVGVTPPTIINETEPETVPAVEGLKSLVSETSDGRFSVTISWNPPEFDSIATFEVTHNTENEEKPSPFRVSSSSATFDNLSTGKYEFKVRVVSAQGNFSEHKTTTVSLSNLDDREETVPRIFGGMPMGIRSNTNGFVTSNGNTFQFENANPVVASIATPFTAVTLTTQSVDISNAPSGLQTFIIFDASAATIAFYEWNTSILTGTGFWRPIGDGSGGQTEFTSVGSIAILAYDDVITGSGFNSSLAVGDIVAFKSTVPTSSSTATLVSKVLEIVSDTKVRIDRIFRDDTSSVNMWRATFRPDINADAAVARINGVN
jgi:predicted phage tail protein